MLRLLLAMLSSPVFAPNSSNVFQERLSALKNRKMALTLLCSLLNTALENKGNPLLHSVSSPSNVYSKLSELALQPKTEDLADLLPSLCCQLIDIVLLPTPPPSSPSAPPAEVNSRPMSPEVQPAGEAEPPPQDDPKPPASTENVFRMYVGKLHRPADLEFVWRNLFQALQHTPAGYSNPIAMIPGLAQTRLDVAECLVLLWRFMDCNKVCPWTCSAPA